MKAIFITGGGSGIGRTTAQLFAARGWRIGLADIDEGGMAGTAALLGDAAVTCHRLDVRDSAAWEAVLADFVSHTDGRIDVLFNNGGIATAGPFIATPMVELERCVAINLMGVVNGAYAGHRYLKAAQGCLVNTASAAGIYGVPGGAIYAATKFAVRGFTESLDGEWHGDRIRVRSLMPGFIDTPLLDAHPVGSNQTVRERIAASPLEFTPVETVAQAVWDAAHGDKLHTLVGKTARRLWFASRFLRRTLRKQVRRGGM